MRPSWLPLVVLATVAACSGPKDGDTTDTDPDADDTEAVGDTDVAGDTRDTAIDTVVTGDTDVTGGDTDALTDTDTGDTGSTGIIWPPHTGHTGIFHTGDTSVPTAACTTTDPNEPNDEPSLATPTGVDIDGDSFSGTDLQLDGGLDDVDLYAATVPAGCRLDATITFDHHDGDLAIGIGDGYSVYTAHDDPLADTESTSWGNRGAAPQDVWVGVAQDDDQCVAYDLTFQLVCPAPCGTVDSDELNDDTASATPSGLGDTDGGTFARQAVGLEGTLADRDLYRVPLQPGCGLVADITFDPADGVQADLWNYYDVFPATGGSPGALQITRFNPSDYVDTSYVEVFTGELECLEYDLDLEVVCDGVPPGLDPSACASDPYEPNDDAASATDTVVSGAVGSFSATDVGIDGRVSPSDDWYRVVVPADCALLATTSFVDEWSDLDLALWGYDATATLTELDYSTGTADSEAILWFSGVSTPTELWLQVYDLSTNSCTVYDVDVDVYCPDPATFRTCGVDLYEPNDDLVTATPTGVSAGGQGFGAVDVEQEGYVVSYDLDYYQFAVPDGCSGRVDLDFHDALADLDLYLVDANLDTVAFSNGSTDHEHAVVTNTTGAALDVWAVVDPYDYACSLYDIAIAVDCP